MSLNASWLQLLLGLQPDLKTEKFPHCMVVHQARLLQFNQCCGENISCFKITVVCSTEPQTQSRELVRWDVWIDLPGFILLRPLWWAMWVQGMSPITSQCLIKKLDFLTFCLSVCYEWYEFLLFWRILSSVIPRSSAPSHHRKQVDELHCLCATQLP